MEDQKAIDNGISSDSNFIEGQDILKTKILKNRYGDVYLDLNGDPRVDKLLERMEVIADEVRAEIKSKKYNGSYVFEDMLSKRAVAEIHSIFGKYDADTERLLNLLEGSQTRLAELKQKIVDEKNPEEVKKINAEIQRLEHDIETNTEIQDRNYNERGGADNIKLVNYPNGKLVCREYTALTALALSSQGVECRYVKGFVNDENESDRTSGEHVFVFLKRSADIVESTDAVNPLRYNVNRAAIKKGETIVGLNPLSGQMLAYGTGRISDDNNFVEIDNSNRSVIYRQIEGYDNALMDEFSYKKTDLLKHYQKESVAVYSKSPELQKQGTLDQLKEDFKGALGEVTKDVQKLKDRAVVLQAEAGAEAIRSVTLNSLVSEVVRNNSEELENKAGEEIIWTDEKRMPYYKERNTPIITPEDLGSAKDTFDAMFKKVSDQVVGMCKGALEKHAPDRLKEIESKYFGDTKKMALVFSVIDGGYIDYKKIVDQIGADFEKVMTEQLESPESKKLQQEILERLRESVKPPEKQTSVNNSKLDEQVARLALSGVELKSTVIQSSSSIPNLNSQNRVMEV